MSFDETFGARLRNCRLQEKLTQQELGDVVGLTKQAINDIEKGRRSTTISKAILLARYFNTTVEFLSGRTDNPSRGQGDYASFVEHLFGDVESSFSYRLRASRLSKNVTTQIGRASCRERV